MSERSRRWWGYWGIWLALGIYMASMDAVMYPKERFLTSLLPLNIIQNLIWGVAGLGILALARRWPLERLSFKAWKPWVIHLVGSVCIALVGLTAIWLVAVANGDPAWRAKMLLNPWNYFRRFFSMYFHMNLLLMWAVLGAYHGLRIYEKYRQRELDASQMESRLSQAQNQALRMQLQPHFLFNTLNSISALIHSDPEAADRMLSRLADLLRMTLDAGSAQEVSLRQELAFVEAYLAIEGIRFQDRLIIRYDVPAECREALVPAFLLQPLVENAIKHGVSDLARPSTIEIRAGREGEWLELVVEDDGRGFTREAGKGREGIGTRNTLDRLRLLYKDRQTFALHSEPGKGTRAVVRIPWVTGEGRP